MATPAFRANHTKHLIGRIKALPAPERDRVLNRIAGARAKVREASIFDWIDAPTHVAIVDGIAESMSRERSIVFWRELAADGFGRTLLRPLVQGAIGLHGKTPKSLIRMAPRAWSLLSRDCGKFRVELERSATEVEIGIDGAPLIVSASTGMLQFFEGGLLATAQWFGLTGRVLTDDRKRERGVLTLHMTWN